jgi:hypothetical protein
VCGRIINPLGESLEGVEIVLINGGSSPLLVKSDAKGRFTFRRVPRGNYTLHATSSRYRAALRDIEVLGAGSHKCETPIEIQLGFDQCDSGVFVPQFDKPSDLDSELQEGKSQQKK